MHGEARNHRWSESDNLSVLNRRRLLVDHAQHGVSFERIDKQRHRVGVGYRVLDTGEETTRTLFKWFQLDDERGLIRPLAGYEVVTDDGFATLNGRVAGQHSVHLVYDLLRAFLTGTGRSRYHDKQRTRIFIGHKAGLGGRHQHDKSHDAHRDRAACYLFVIDKERNTFLIFLCRAVKHAIKVTMEAADKGRVTMIFLLVVGLQENSA